MMEAILLTIVLAPLAGAIIAGLFRNQVGRSGAHSVTILGVGISCLLSLYVLWLHAFQGAPVYNESVYVWMVSDGLRMEIAFLIEWDDAFQDLVHEEAEAFDPKDLRNLGAYNSYVAANDMVPRRLETFRDSIALQFPLKPPEKAFLKFGVNFRRNMLISRQKQLGAVKF